MVRLDERLCADCRSSSLTKNVLLIKFEVDINLRVSAVKSLVLA